METIRCLCPGSPHDSDSVTFKERLGFRDASNIRNGVRVLDRASLERTVEIATALTEGYLLYGIESWTLVDAKGKAVPVSPDAVAEYLLPHIDVAIPLGDLADDLYGEQVIVPLLQRGSTSSPPTRTNGSTSPANGRHQKPSARSKRSSISTIPTGGTGATTPSPGGASN